MTFTPELARRQFSALSRQIDGKPAIFFDGPGGAQVSRGVLEKMTDYLGKYNANLGGHYFSSRVTGEVMSQARESVRALLNAPSPDNIVFGMNMTTLTFHLSRIISRDWRDGDEVIVTAPIVLSTRQKCARASTPTRVWWRSATRPTSPAASSISKPSLKPHIGWAHRCMSTPFITRRIT